MDNQATNQTPGVPPVVQNQTIGTPTAADLNNLINQIASQVQPVEATNQVQAPAPGVPVTQPVNQPAVQVPTDSVQTQVPVEPSMVQAVASVAPKTVVAESQESVNPQKELKITLFKTANCPFCKAEKDFLNKNSLLFVEKDVESDEASLKEMLALSDNFAGVPVTFLQNKDKKTVIKGFTEADFMLELEKIGLLTNAKPVESVMPSEKKSEAVANNDSVKVTAQPVVSDNSQPSATPTTQAPNIPNL